jgi:hypothetical protein
MGSGTLRVSAKSSSDSVGKPQIMSVAIVTAEPGLVKRAEHTMAHDALGRTLHAAWNALACCTLHGSYCIPCIASCAQRHAPPVG